MTVGAVGRGDWQTRSEAEEITCDAGHFHDTVTQRAFEGEACAFAKTWTFTFPRDLV